MAPKLRADDGKNVIIRPLFMLLESVGIREYTKIKRISVHVVFVYCPLMCGETVHGDYKHQRIKVLIKQLETEIPDIRNSLLAKS